MKRVILVLLIVTMVFALFACKPKKTETDDNSGNNLGDKVEDNNKDDHNTPQNENTKLKLYFVNREYILTGSEDLTKVIEVEREVELGQQPIEEVILKELKKRPGGQELTTIVDKINILGVKTKGNTAYVDVSSDNLNGGSMEEQLILQQIVLSLTELDGIDEVQFLIDGENAETLMGHISIEEPLKRSEVE